MLGLNLPVLHVNLVPTKNDWNVLTDPAITSKSRRVNTNMMRKISETQTETRRIRLKEKIIITLHNISGKVHKPAQIPMPRGNILVRQPCSNVEHDNSTLSMDTAHTSKPV